MIGRRPTVSLKSARLARDEVRKSLSQGRDPSIEARRVKLVGAGNCCACRLGQPVHAAFDPYLSTGSSLLDQDFRAAE